MNRRRYGQRQSREGQTSERREGVTALWQKRGQLEGKRDTGIPEYRDSGEQGTN